MATNSQQSTGTALSTPLLTSLHWRYLALQAIGALSSHSCAMLDHYALFRGLSYNKDLKLPISQCRHRGKICDLNAPSKSESLQQQGTRLLPHTNFCGCGLTSCRFSIEEECSIGCSSSIAPRDKAIQQKEIITWEVVIVQEKDLISQSPLHVKLGIITLLLGCRCNSTKFSAVVCLENHRSSNDTEHLKQY